MPPQLVALTEGPSILLDKPILLMGRHQECDIQLVSRKVSRRHCCIAQVGDHLVIRDLGSTNGIRINGVRVLEGKLKPGDEITIGSYRYQVQWSALPHEPVSPSRGYLATRHEAPVHPAGKIVDDEMLESCEEPVPLAEGKGKVVPKLTGKLKKPNHSPQDAPSVAQDPDHTAAFQDHRSLILPEHIDLAPISDSLPPAAPPPAAPPS